MKTKHFILSAAVLTMSVALSLTSCRKDESKDSDTTGTEDNALADKSYEDMGQMSNEAANGSVGSYKVKEGVGILSNCVTLTHDSVAKTITIDFTANNCLCNDGRYRRGKIFVSYTAGFHNLGYWDSLCNITITTVDPLTTQSTYFVGFDQNNMHQLIGTRSVTNNGHNAAGHMNWTVAVNGEVIKPNSQGKITWVSNRNLEWSAGESTIFWWLDDEYSVTGSGSGTSAKGVPFSVNITSPLVWKVACPKHFTEGTFDFTPGSKPVRHVDFSPPNNGQCDDIAVVTINGTPYTVHMK